MLIALKHLPNDLDALKSLVLEQTLRNQQLTTENQPYKAKVLSLQEQLNLALARRYAASSEKLSPDQIRLFDEAEQDTVDETDTDTEESITIPAHTRKKSGRKKLPESLARVDVIHEIPEAMRLCPHDGKVLTEINSVISEQLDIIPAQIRVLRHIRKQYACDCGRCIQTAPLPAQPIPRAWPHRDHWRTSRCRNTRTPCRCTARRRSCSALGWNFPEPPWRIG